MDYLDFGVDGAVGVDVVDQLRWLNVAITRYIVIRFLLLVSSNAVLLHTTAIYIKSFRKHAMRPLCKIARHPTLRCRAPSINSIANFKISSIVSRYAKSLSFRFSSRFPSFIALTNAWIPSSAAAPDAADYGAASPRHGGCQAAPGRSAGSWGPSERPRRVV